jgi:L-ascorbate metabolism protein UlaG (beta-lactamase superfamily)
MDRHDAVRAAALIGAPQVVPIHYNTFPAIETDAAAFAEAVAAETSATATILDPGESLTL